MNASVGRFRLSQPIQLIQQLVLPLPDALWSSVALVSGSWWQLFCGEMLFLLHVDICSNIYCNIDWQITGSSSK